MLNISPLKVIHFDDDPAARRDSVANLSRHLLTLMVAECSTPADLLRAVDTRPDVDAILVDAEYRDPALPLGQLLGELIDLAPDAAVLPLSLYGQQDVAAQAIRSGAHGFLLKNEIGLAIVSAIWSACQGEFVITPGVASLVENEFPHLLARAKKINTWRPNPRLTPRVAAAFDMFVLRNMKAKLVAAEMSVEVQTVQRYVNQAYGIVEDIWADDTILQGLDLSLVSPEDRAFHWYTLPPRAS